jgi:hypothetical protein
MAETIASGSGSSGSSGSSSTAPAKSAPKIDETAAAVEAAATGAERERV